MSRLYSSIWVFVLKYWSVIGAGQNKNSSLKKKSYYFNFKRYNFSSPHKFITLSKRILALQILLMSYKHYFDIFISCLLAESHLLSVVWVSSQDEQTPGTGNKFSLCLSLKQWGGAADVDSLSEILLHNLVSHCHLVSLLAYPCL